MRKTLIASAISLALITGCASNDTLSKKEILNQYPTLSQATTLIDQAKNENLAFYSPEKMKAAQQAYDIAMKQAESGQLSANVPAKEAVDKVNAAMEQADKAKYDLEEVFTARTKALDANADKLVPDKFNETDKELKKMLAYLEAGEEGRAKRDVIELKNQYLAIELTALKTNMLSIAKTALEKARKQDLGDVVPELVAQAEDEYKLAVKILEADRQDTGKANVHSNRTIWLIDRAHGVADINKYFENASFTEEQKIVWFQEQLSEALSPVMTDVPFNRPNKEVIALAKTTLMQQVEENKTLKNRVTSLNSRLDNVQMSAKDREQQLLRDKDEVILSAQLELEKEQQTKREVNERFAGVQALFNENEANVYRQMDNVLIRAQGFAFKSGTSEIESSNFPLLNKIVEAIRRFPNADIVVSGHTDATGSAELNLKLSEDRAQTVASFLSEVGNIDPSRITSKGYGKEKPVASNESAEGRAENRRVEVLIVNP